MVGLNYLYYGALFILLLITTTSSVLTKQPELSSKIFFWLYSIGQALFEITFLCLMGEIIRKKLSQKWFWIFAGFTFWVFIWHSLDFLLDRILDLSFWNTIGFVLDESFENFLLLLDASGVPIWGWVLIFTVLGIIPLMGAGIYWITNWLSQKRPWALESDFLLQLLFCIPAGLLYWDFVGSRAIDPDSYNAFTTSLPWKRTFRMPTSVVYQTETSLAPLPNETDIQRQVTEASTLTLQKKPNIYLFVAESLRSDFVNAKTAPNLTQFREENISSSLAVSNANSTMISWFSTFHSQFPVYWSAMSKSDWSMGSPSLALLKNLGYEIHLYTSAQLEFYGMERLLFGKDQSLLTSVHTFHHLAPKEAWQSDLETVEALEKNTKQEGQVSIIFWDSTHFDYSWPKYLSPPFTPYAKAIAYFNIFQTPKNQEEIRNRYRNAIHYLDSLFGRCLKSIPPDSIVVFLGDHGEEFFDHGHLFHNSHLTQEQITIPLYFKIPGYPATHLPLTTQIDIFPTVLEAVTGKTYPFLTGESLLHPKQSPYVISARFNASRTPQEFALQNLHHKAIVRFEGAPFTTTRLRLVSLRENGDDPLRRCPEKCDDWLHSEFGPLLDRLFPPAKMQ